ncbi:MAG: ATP-binding protein [Bacteroidales bacterium]
MNWFIKKKQNGIRNYPLIRQYIRFRASIYGRVVLIITLLSLFLFISFGFIFRSVNNKYLNSVILQNVNNIGSIVESSLYYSMLDNDKSRLQSTLDVINTMSGIDEVNMYDSNDSLVYSSFANDTTRKHGNPDCRSCHNDLKTMFPALKKSYWILDSKHQCKMQQIDYNHRHLLIKSPILNQKSCYLSSCHAHKASDKVLGSLVIKVPLYELDSALEKFTANFYLLAVISTLTLAVFLILFTNKKIKKPLNEIINASKAVAKGDLNIRLDVKQKQLDDMRMVSHAFNNMLDKLHAASVELQNWSYQLEYKVQKKSEELLEAQNELIHIERIASIGKLSSSVAHEINNPLSGVLTYTKLVQKQLNKVEMEENLKESVLKNLTIIESETKRCGEIVKGLLDFSRNDQQNFEIVHLHKILKETYDLMVHQMKISDISFLTDFSATQDLIKCSPNQIKQACVALLVNASEAIFQNGEIVMKTSNPNNQTVKIEIGDNGSGIAPEDMKHIFEPFFSSKQKASGTGLGLAIVHGIVQNHKGVIDVVSDVGKGTTVSIALPVVKNKEV